MTRARSISSEGEPKPDTLETSHVRSVHVEPCNEGGWLASCYSTVPRQSHSIHVFPSGLSLNEGSSPLPSPSPSSLSFSKAALGHENDHNNHAMLSPAARCARAHATAAALEDKKGGSLGCGDPIPITDRFTLAGSCDSTKTVPHRNYRRILKEDVETVLSFIHNYGIRQFLRVPVPQY